MKSIIFDFVYLKLLRKLWLLPVCAHLHWGLHRCVSRSTLFHYLYAIIVLIRLNHVVIYEFIESNIQDLKRHTHRQTHTSINKCM